MADVTTHIWFGYEDGVNGCHFEWAPAPVRGISVANAGYSEGQSVQSGRRTRHRSTQFSKVYGITAVGESKDMDGYSVYNRAAAGFYGRHNWHFADPYAFETNLFPFGWATPGAAETGWQKISQQDPVYDDVPITPYGLPKRQAVYRITTPSGASPLSSPNMPYVIIPIPPTHTLHLGATGSASGSGVVRVEAWPNDGFGPLGIQDLTMLPSFPGDDRMNATVSGSTAAFAKIYLTRSAATVSSVTLVSMTAQLWPTGYTPELTGIFLPGEGHTKLQFADEAIMEDYIYMYPPQKGISTTLEEVI